MSEIKVQIIEDAKKVILEMDYEWLAYVLGFAGEDEMLESYPNVKEAIQGTWKLSDKEIKFT